MGEKKKKETRSKTKGKQMKKSNFFKFYDLIAETLRCIVKRAMAALEFGPEKIRLINTLNEFAPYSDSPLLTRT